MLATVAATGAQAREDGCKGARATAAAKNPCGDYRPTLRVTAFGDQFPTADDVGTTGTVGEVRRFSQNPATHTRSSG